MKAPLGYDIIDGKLVVNENEAEIVKFVFKKQEEYTNNPPKELVIAVIEDYASRGEPITYEEAKSKVSYSAILNYVTAEVNSNPKYVEILKRKEMSY